MDDAAPALFAYQCLLLAAGRFGLPFDELDRAQRLEVERVAARKARIEQAVLESPQALRSVVGAEAIHQSLAALRAQFSDPGRWARAVAAVGLSMAPLQRGLELSLRAADTLQCTCAVEVSDADASLYYELHRSQFMRPEQRQVRHILITINDDFTENRRAVARGRIDALAHVLASNPAAFAELAMQHSECPSALEGGALGWVAAGQLYPELDEALFALPSLGTTPVIETSIGLHLLRCEAVRPPAYQTLDQVLPRLRSVLEARQSRAAQRRWVQALLAGGPARAETGRPASI